MNLSVIVITKDAEKKLKRCLESLKFADEILVVDSGSTDETLLIAKESGARIIKTRDVGYAKKRNMGAKNAKGEWLLYIDSDEIVSEKLAAQIKKLVRDEAHTVVSFRIYRKNIILGKWLRHGGWWPDPVHRLIKKSAFVRWEGALHEQPRVADQRVGVIQEPIVHFSKDSVSEMVENSKKFAPIEARLLFEARHPPVGIHHFFLAMWREFWNRGILQFGWLDGPIGILEVGYQMFHQVLVYGTLWEMQRAKKQKTRSNSEEN